MPSPTVVKLGSVERLSPPGAPFKPTAVPTVAVAAWITVLTVELMEALPPSAGAPVLGPLEAGIEGAARLGKAGSWRPVPSPE